MKKFSIGLLVGIILSLPIASYTDSIIGKVIQGTFPLIIDGQRCPKDVIVVDGTSYLPVRSAGELFGYEVDFIDKQVILNKETVEETTVQTTVQNEGDNVTTQNIHANVANIISNSLNINRNEEVYLIADNEIYLPVSIFSNFLKTDSQQNYINITFNLSGQEPITFTLENTREDKPLYSTGIDIFKKAGKFYIKASTLGLTTTIDGNTLYIEQ